MLDLKTLPPKQDQRYLTVPEPPKPHEIRQRRLMVGALVLLLAALALLLYKDRDFWFPETQEAEDLPGRAVPATTTTPGKQVAAAPAIAKKQQNPKPQAKRVAPAADTTPPVGVQRSALPPLEVEVVAGDSLRRVHPGTNSVRVDMQPGVPAQAVNVGAASPPPEAAVGVPSNAAERVQMSADTSTVVTHSVKPGYPLLARQMKVQGSVILEALIGRDGAIQDLHVLSGPPILASAAEEAVRQWRFKPHYQGQEAVETQARITVNFTISTN